VGTAVFTAKSIFQRILLKLTEQNVAQQKMGVCRIRPGFQIFAYEPLSSIGVPLFDHRLGVRKCGIKLSSNPICRLRIVAQNFYRILRIDDVRESASEGYQRERRGCYPEQAVHQLNAFAHE
jgi:hypothetical protein